MTHQSEAEHHASLPQSASAPSDLYSQLSSSQWYDYAPPSPSVSDDASTPPIITNPGKPKRRRQQASELMPDHILALASLLPSTRPLLSQPKFLSALELTPDEVQQVREGLKAASGNESGSKKVRARSKLDELRESELKLAKKEREELMKQNEREKEARVSQKRQELDDTLGLKPQAKNKRLGVEQSQPEISDCIQAHGLPESRKRRRIAELDELLGLVTDTLSSTEPNSQVQNDAISEKIEQAIENHVEHASFEGNTATARMATIDVLLGLTSNADAQPKTSTDGDKNAINNAEDTRMRIDRELGLLDNAKRAQLDLVLGLLSPRKTKGSR